MSYLKGNVPNFDSFEAFREPEKPAEAKADDGVKGRGQRNNHRSRTISNLLHVSAGAEDRSNPARVSGSPDGSNEAQYM